MYTIRGLLALPTPVTSACQGLGEGESFGTCANIVMVFSRGSARRQFSCLYKH